MKNKWLAIMFSISLLGEIPIGVKATEVADMVSPGFQEIGISYTAGRLHVSGGNGLLLSIYNVAGERVSSFRVEGNDKTYDLHLLKGCYIVKVGNTVRKISVC